MELISGIFTRLIDWQRNNNTEEAEVTTRSTMGRVPVNGVYWESDKLTEDNVYDVFTREGLERIPNVEDEVESVTESHYSFSDFRLMFMPDDRGPLLANGIPELDHNTTSVSPSGSDAGVVVGIVIAAVTGVVLIGGLVVWIMYRHYMHRNRTSMNFDNPVYRKTTEDQLTLEKNGYAPGSKLYAPSTIAEEAQEPLTSPSTNDFV